jgi:uncharacterized 2Fe-2S/4Fe-4S cluster protein (DUF4445 family)
MHHLLLRINPAYLVVAPFPPVIHRSIDVKARDLGLKVHPSANVHILPIEAGFVGADNVGVLIAEEPYNQDEMLLIIDIGTNGEIVLAKERSIVTCSTAAGPAFEGAGIVHGMRAEAGAIVAVRMNEDVRLSVVERGHNSWDHHKRGWVAVV